MTETTQTPPVLSPQTQACVQGLVRAKAEILQWQLNLQRALADDIGAVPPRLTPEQAASIAKENEVDAPPPPKEQPEAVETTPESNQAQLDAQTKLSEEEAAKTAPPPPKQRQPTPAEQQQRAKDEEKAAKAKEDDKAHAQHR